MIAREPHRSATRRQHTESFRRPTHPMSGKQLRCDRPRDVDRVRDRSGGANFRPKASNVTEVRRNLFGQPQQHDSKRPIVAPPDLRLPSSPGRDEILDLAHHPVEIFLASQAPRNSRQATACVVLSYAALSGSRLADRRAGNAAFATSRPRAGGKSERVAQPCHRRACHRESSRIDSRATTSSSDLRSTPSRKPNALAPQRRDLERIDEPMRTPSDAQQVGLRWRNG
jgi:hypothetical protein